MGIAPYKTFTFDGESSGDYGVYITGTGVFNAPERSVELIEIPNRNGAYALDKGKFENIEVTYNVGIVDDSESDFADRVAAFRNWICSKVGYCRLEDEYNPDEYRMALFSSGVEIDHDLLIAGEAEITFNCKPQRWLKSGETAVTVADGGTIDNPTLFEANPLLELYGYGEITMGNSEPITLENLLIGEIVVKTSSTSRTTSPNRHDTLFGQFDNTFLNIGDALYLNGVQMTASYQRASGYTNVSCTVASQTATTATCTPDGLTKSISSDLVFTYGTAQTVNQTGTFTVKYTYNGSTTTNSVVLDMDVVYDGARRFSISRIAGHAYPETYVENTVVLPDIIGDSTQSALGNPTYIDLDIGEAYKVSGTSVVTLNNAAIIPSDLPTLKPGTNTINYDNTFTQVDIVPRWWRV